MHGPIPFLTVSHYKYTYKSSYIDDSLVVTTTFLDISDWGQIET